MMLTTLLCDYYKLGHVDQYPPGISRIWTNWTPRYTKRPGVDSATHRVTHFGLQYFIKDYLQRRFNEGFFNRPKAEVIAEYVRVVRATLGITSPHTKHLERLHDYGTLPITIYSIPEGFSTRCGVPSMVIVNTEDWAFWLPNFLETMLSMVLWKGSTSATTAARFRRLGTKYARQFGHTDLSFLDWQFHDFSMRGMSGLEDAVLSGMGHLTSFSGTDTIPAILAAEQYYVAGLCGGSVPATEHSVMCAGGKQDEFETFRRLIEDVYPSGIVSIVSDTWDLWKVLTEFVPRLRNSILARNGKIVIRPDSGDPVAIMIGDEDNGVRELLRPHEWQPLHHGVLSLLARTLGTTNGLINNAGAIYGDSINEARAEAILKGCIAKGLSPFNAVFGVGSFTYEFQTRDTDGFAMKATAVVQHGKLIPIFKDPVTDDGGKKSAYGIPAVYRTEVSTDANPDYFMVDGCSPEALDNCAFEKVYENGKLLIDTPFSTIRARARAWELEAGV